MDQAGGIALRRDKPLPASAGARAGASWSGWSMGVSWPSRRSSMRCCCVGRSPGTTSSLSISIAWGPASRFRLRRGVNPARTANRPSTDLARRPGPASRQAQVRRSDSPQRSRARPGWEAFCRSRGRFHSTRTPCMGPPPPAAAPAGTRGDEWARWPVSKSSRPRERDDAGSIPDRFGPQAWTLPPDRRHGASVRSRMGPAAQARRLEPT